MKIKPQIYAETLVASLDDKPDFKGLASKLWHKLQKNKQYKDLPRILSALDVEYAKSQKMTLAKVYSEKALSEAEIEEIKGKLSLRGVGARRGNLSGGVMVKNIIRHNIAGVTVEIDGEVIDLSVRGSIERLKRVLSN